MIANIGWKTIAGMAVMGIGYVVTSAFPQMFPGVDWKVPGDWMIGAGGVLAGVGARHALGKLITVLGTVAELLKSNEPKA